MNQQDLLRTFIVESHELLEAMESTLLAVDESGADLESINAIFRVAHTIKGSAGMFGLEHIVHFAHAVEEVLEAVRGGRLSLDGELVNLLLSCCDHQRALIAAVEAGRMDADAKSTRDGAPLLHALQQYRAESEAKRLDAEVAPANLADPWQLSLRFGARALRNGMDPLSFIRYLEGFGQIVALVTLFDAMPEAEQMDPEACYLGFEITLRSDSDKAALERVFELAGDDCEVRILPPQSRVSQYVQLIRGLPEAAERLGEILVGCGSLTQRELDSALSSQRRLSAAPDPIGEILVRRGSLRPEVLDAALQKQRQVKDAKAQESRSVRVDADKLDQLINLVGELIIASASTSLVARRARLPEVQQCTATLTSLVEAVRDNVLQLRMVKIGATFKRFQRVVYDVSRELGKDITLSVSGEDSELDKTVVEKIGDPLLHLVRNAIDHGIESAEVRAVHGKPATGTVSLNAYHDAGSIVIQVSDDGGGLKRDKIVSKAIQRGLLESGRSLTDGEVYNLIFEPGFSTADEVTNLSGRGVGMDVVKRNITALRGSVGVASQEGVGTTVTVRLPLTLAIINGFLVGLGQSMFVVPLDMIEECMELSGDADRDFTDLRGGVLLIRLGELFSLKSPRSSRQNVVVVKSGGQRAGLVVDTLLGEFQTVIKPLGKMFNRVTCISGSSILGSGEVALILDLPEKDYGRASDSGRDLFDAHRARGKDDAGCARGGRRCDHH